MEGCSSRTPRAPTNQLVCRHCYHPVEVHNVNETGECGCVRLVPIDYAAREARKRTWIAEVEMSVKNRPISSGSFRVRAAGAAGAAALALRQAKREHLKPRTRVAQFRISLTPVPKSVAK